MVSEYFVNMIIVQVATTDRKTTDCKKLDNKITNMGLLKNISHRQRCCVNCFVHYYLTYSLFFVWLTSSYDARFHDVINKLTVIPAAVVEIFLIIYPSDDHIYQCVCR